MPLSSLPVLSLADDKASFSQAIGDSFRTFGFAMVKDHGIDADLIARAWQLTEAFFALPVEEKRKYHIPAIAGARGYTPFGVEIAKDARAHDLKEFWHIGRDLPEGSPLADSMPPNVWPERPEASASCSRNSTPSSTGPAQRSCRVSPSTLGLRRTGSTPGSRMETRSCACSTIRRSKA
jgi:isopenicillin N synthase-like dioxygenase